MRIAIELHLKRLLLVDLKRFMKSDVYSVMKEFQHVIIQSLQRLNYMKHMLIMNDMMDLTENMIAHIAQEVLGTTTVPYGEHEINLAPGWKRCIWLMQLKKLQVLISWKEMTIEEAKAFAKEHNVEVPDTMTGVGHIINEFFEQKVEEKIVQPTFIYGHPVEVSPLAKKNPEDARFTDRFELFIVWS